MSNTQVELMLKLMKFPNDLANRKVLLMGNDLDSLMDRTIRLGHISYNQTCLTLQEFIYHEALTLDEKREIYGSPYEIGHPDPITSDSEKDFFDYLSNTYMGDDVASSVNDIKKEITKLTSIPFITFLQNDRSLAYKVITLFYRIKRNHRLQIFNLLTSTPKAKANFEFRSSHPCSLEDSENNTAIISEVLTQLTFSMSKGYLNQARSCLADIVTAANGMSSYIASEINHQPETIAGLTIVKTNVGTALASLLEDRHVASDEDRLDFLLYSTIVLHEFAERSRSNKMVTQIAFKAPLSLRSLRGAKLSSFAPKDTVPFLLGKQIRIQKPLLRKAEFLIQIYQSYNLQQSLSFRVRAGDLSTSVEHILMPALIIHDKELKIKIPSSVMGASNVPTSVMSVLNDAIAEGDKNGNTPLYNNKPEALSIYWEARVNLAKNVLLSKDREYAAQRLLTTLESEVRIDDALIKHLKYKGLQTYKALPGLPNWFAVALGYNINAPVNYVVRS